MIRTLLTTTALVALMAGGALAQDAAVTATPNLAGGVLAKGYTSVDSDNLATEIIGKQVYSSAAADAEHIGDVNNLVIGDDGNVAAVVIGVGGFLGIGEKNVAVSMDELKWVTAEDNTERFVLETTKEALATAPDFTWIDDAPTDTAAAPAKDGVVDETATGTTAPANKDAMAPAGTAKMDPLDRTKLTDFDESKLTAEELIGTNVYGTNDEHIGAIGDLALNEDGSVDAIVIDFGGFLGIGTKPVAVAYEDLTFLADPDKNRSLILPITREQMDAAPAFNRDTYTAERDTQRILVDAQS